MSFLTIGISTVKNNLSTLLGRLDDYLDILPIDVSFLVVSQGYSSNAVLEYNSRIKIIESKTLGLSKNRNIVIENTKTDWLWIQDDDFRLCESELIRMLDFIRKSSCDIIFTKIISLEDNDKHYKNYKFHQKHLRLNALKISSIEIVIRKSFINKNKILFSNEFGLGTNLPCCEENIFILDCFDKTDNVCYSDFSCCYHTTLDENRNIDYSKNYYAKGVFLKKLPFYISILLILRWSFLSSRLNKFKALKFLSLGYICK